MRLHACGLESKPPLWIICSVTAPCYSQIAYVLVPSQHPCAMRIGLNFAMYCSRILQGSKLSRALHPPTQPAVPKCPVSLIFFHTNIAILRNITIFFSTPQPTTYYTKKAHYAEFPYTNISIHRITAFAAIYPPPPLPPWQPLYPPLCPLFVTSALPQTPLCILCLCWQHMCSMSAQSLM